MADHTRIEWTDSTFNPWIGCTKVGPGCDHCYAEADFDLRKHRAKWGPGNPRSRTSPGNWKKPRHWNANACWFVQCDDCGWRGESKGATCGRCQGANTTPARRRVFCASLADVFDNDVPTEWRMDLFSLIAQTPNLDWLILTKRIGNVMKMCQADGLMFDVICNRVWLGATICTQPEADRDIIKLLAIPARVRWLSMEPLLGPVDISHYLRPMFRQSSDPDWQDLHDPLDWVVVGGESGPNARPMHHDWARSLRDQCAEVGVPMLFKQWGEWSPDDAGETPHSDTVGILPSGDCAYYSKGYVAPFDTQDRLEAAGGIRLDGRTLMDRVGKKAAGRLLDGIEHNAYPVPR
ncbi:MAG: phage Gp37/Gp68 family protein [Rhodocyclales bacterium]|nr:phage Gp37/Gp68 family protein [Rhodocyclales bacterium]